MKMKDLTPEQRKEVEDSMKDARSAVGWSVVYHIFLSIGLFAASSVICKISLPKENYQLGVGFVSFLTFILIFCSMYDNVSKITDQLREEIQNIVGNK
jgi:Flp pilus assembly protein TadB